MYYKDLLRYRNAWMGIALIWVILFHTQIPFADRTLDVLRQTGYGGVDLCLFASGLGCFYSLSSDGDIGRFMTRRVKRIMPMYLLFMVFWLWYQHTLGKLGFQMAVGNLLAVQNFTGLGDAFNWYISALWLLYLLAPYFKTVIDRGSAWKKLLFFLLLLSFSIPFWSSNTLIITVTRLPIFYMGMLAADICRKERKLKVWHILPAAALLVLGAWLLVTALNDYGEYLWSHGLHWYPFILITPPACMFISLLMWGLEKTVVLKPVAWLFDLMGNYSLEMYLVHIPLIAILTDYITQNGLQDEQWKVWAAGCGLLAVGCGVLRLLTKAFNFLFLRERSA